MKYETRLEQLERADPENPYCRCKTFIGYRDQKDDDSPPHCPVCGEIVAMVPGKPIKIFVGIEDSE